MPRAGLPVAPTVSTGFNHLMDSWNTMAMRAPRTSLAENVLAESGRRTRKRANEDEDRLPLPR
jgi:hypothetical protein